MSFARSAYSEPHDDGAPSGHLINTPSPSSRTYEQQGHDDSLMASTLTQYLQSTSTDGVSPMETQPHVVQYDLQVAAAAATNINTPTDQGMLADDLNNLGDSEGKQRRLGRACDACSKRKVKCGDQVPCKHCVDLGTPCTFSRPTKRRGPVNRMADELKKQRLVSDVLIPGDAPDLTGSDTYLSLVAISSFESIQRMVFEFYTYVYPMFPFPHEHLTLDRLRKREDIHNKSFSGLIASMVALLVTLYPKAAEKAISVDGNGEVFLEHLMARCMLVCEQARGPLCGERNVNEAIAHFFVALVHHLRKQTAQVPLFLGESLSIVHYLKVESDSPSSDHVTRELCKRLYWAIYGLSRSLIQTGEMLEIMPPRKISQLPRPPLELDDYYIYASRLDNQPHGQLSLIQSTNYITRIYASYHGLLKFEFLEDDDRNHASMKVQEAAILKMALKEVDSVAAGLHSELCSNLDPQVIASEQEDGYLSPEIRLQLRREVQKIFLRMTIIKTRYYLNARLSRLLDAAYDHERLVSETWRSVSSDLEALVNNVSVKSLAPLGGLVPDHLKRVYTALKARGVVEEGCSELLIVGNKLRELFGDDFVP